MRILVAGATGAIGRQLVPLLSSVGHDVVAVSRRGGGPATDGPGRVESVRADALDADGIARAVTTARPDVIVNLLTAIPDELDPRRMRRDFAQTNRLRTEGTNNLLTAADRLPEVYVISEGLAYAYEPGPGPADEDVPFWAAAPKQFAPNVEALRVLEKRTARSRGAVLRFGHLYGPGTTYAQDGSFTRQVRSGKVPLVGGGTSVFSFTHVHDAATAILAAADRRPAGALNIVDDEPAAMATWLPRFAGIVGGRPPKDVPAALARLAVGSAGVAFMTRLRGADNARARLRLNWRPRYTTWREGFGELLIRAA